MTIRRLVGQESGPHEGEQVTTQFLCVPAVVIASFNQCGMGKEIGCLEDLDELTVVEERKEWLFDRSTCESMDSKFKTGIDLTHSSCSTVEGEVIADVNVVAVLG